MNNVKNALTRKLGPFPAWVWLALFAVGVWYYRSKFSSAASGTGTGSVAQTPLPPQPDTTLQPGESVYDPNTGTLTSSPFSPDTGVGGSTPTPTGGVDSSQAVEDLANALVAAEQAGTGNPAPVVNVTVPSQSSAAPPATKKGKPKRKPTVNPGGVMQRPGRPFRIPKRRKPEQKTVQYQPAKNKQPARSRSAATIRNPVGGRTTARGNTAPATGRARGSASPPNQKSNYRGRTPVVAQPVQRQRPVATHPKPAPKPPHVPSPRPSSPPPRTANRNRKHK